MRLLFASLAAVTAVAFAAPSFAQDTPSSPTPTPITKPVKHRTSSTGCSALKGQSAREYCLKQQRAHAHATKPHKASKKVASSKSAPSTMPSDTAPVTQSAPSPSQSQSVAVPPLPQKTL